MAAPTAQPIYRNSPASPQLRDVLDLWKRDALLSTNCHAIASVKGFNAADDAFTPPRPSITAQINYCRTIFLPDKDGNPAPQYIEYPALLNVPVVVAGGGGGGSVGGASLTFPIAIGDQCLILFNDRSLDNWVNGATSGPIASPRLHHLTDGLALVGFPLFSTDGAIGTQYSPDHAMLSNGAAQVGANGLASKVLITNDPTHSNNLYSLLQALITAVKNITVDYTPGTLVAGGNPVTAVSNPVAVVSSSSQSDLDTAATNLASLLE